MARGSHHSSSSHSGSHHSSHSSSSSHRSSSSHSSYHSSHSSYRGSSSSGSSFYSSLSGRQPGSAPTGVTSYHGNWIYGSQFNLNKQDPLVMERMKKASLVNTVMLTKIWAILLFMGFFLMGSNLYYELVIPFFEAIPMADLTFTIFDELVYFTPLIVFVVATIIIFTVIKRDNDKQRAICKEVVAYYQEEERKRQIALDAQEKLNHTELYTECPNCCAPVPYGSLNCEYCGSSLVKNG